MSVATGTAGFWAGVCCMLAGIDDATLGDVAWLLFFDSAAGGIGASEAGTGADAGVEDEAAVEAPGGGGRGAMPTAFLSLAAAAAAAEAYFSGSPGALVGIGAGFMVFDVVTLVVLLFDACSVARAGKGDFSWLDGLRVVVICVSDAEADFCLEMGAVVPRTSGGSGKSSAMD